MTIASKIAIIDNAGPNTLKSFLGRANRNVRIDIASAFITKQGLDHVKRTLKRAKSARILTGLYQGFTEPDALTMLLELQEETNGRISVHLSDRPRFHWKLYVLGSRSITRVALGSSNLTADGLDSRGELNAILSGGQGENVAGSLAAIFLREWQNHSLRLDSGQIERYRRWHIGQAVARHQNPPLRIILGRVSRDANIAKRTPNYWRLGIDGYVSKQTGLLVEEATNWDQTGWDWMSSEGTRLAEGDLLIVFNNIDKKVQIAKIRDTTSGLPTPDGREFAAFMVVRGKSERRMTPTLWAILKESGLLRWKRQTRDTRKISEAKYGRFVKAIRS